jgi:hypothetical protein
VPPLLLGKVPFPHSSPTSISSNQTARSEEVSNKYVCSIIYLINVKTAMETAGKTNFLPVTFHINLIPELKVGSLYSSIYIPGNPMVHIQAFH